MANLITNPSGWLCLYAWKRHPPPPPPTAGSTFYGGKRCFWTKDGLDNVNQTVALPVPFTYTKVKVSGLLAFEPGAPSTVGMPYLVLYLLEADLQTLVSNNPVCESVPHAEWTAVANEFPVTRTTRYFRLIMKRNGVVGAPATTRRAFYRKLTLEVA